jgi:hypothetical protein
MKFGIRDDDTNYFTKPTELERAFRGIWERCPVSLAVVPFHACTKSGAIPKKHWDGDRMFPIGKNRPLVRFLRRQIHDGKVSIMLHGYSHKDYHGGYEFVAGDNLYGKLIEGKEYLEALFDTRITAFVPPHNSITERGMEAVRKARLNVVGIPSVRFPSRSWFQEAFYEKLYGLPSPHPFDCGTHREVYGYYLTPENAAYHRKALKFNQQRRGVFCLTGHYWELQQGPLRETYRGFVRDAFAADGVTFHPVDELFA